VHLPGAVPFRANIDALKRIGCTDVLAVSAVGSLREEMAPGDFVMVSQYIDRTDGRTRSFFGTGCVAHVAFGEPVCARLSAVAAEAARSAGARVHEGAVYLAMEGPQFSTRAESQMHRAWGADVVGMTGMPEAKLAREAELCYASLTMVTDWDAWRTGEAAVDVAAVVATLNANAARARATVAGLPRRLSPERAACPCGCDRALDHAVMTAPGSRDPALIAKLDAVAGRVLGSGE
jgi:5'-methylthioadenosine phosphorylase